MTVFTARNAEPRAPTRQPIATHDDLRRKIEKLEQKDEVPSFPVRQNLPFLFIHCSFGGIASIVSQCSAISPPSTRNRS